MPKHLLPGRLLLTNGDHDTDYFLHTYIASYRLAHFITRQVHLRGRINVAIKPRPFRQSDSKSLAYEYTFLLLVPFTMLQMIDRDTIFPTLGYLKQSLSPRCCPVLL
jgi:hypothetical protein